MICEASQRAFVLAAGSSRRSVMLAMSGIKDGINGYNIRKLLSSFAALFTFALSQICPARFLLGRPARPPLNGLKEQRLSANEDRARHPHHRHRACGRVISTFHGSNLGLSAISSNSRINGVS